MVTCSTSTSRSGAYLRWSGESIGAKNWADFWHSSEPDSVSTPKATVWTKASARVVGRGKTFMAPDIQTVWLTQPQCESKASFPAGLRAPISVHSDARSTTPREPLERALLRWPCGQLRAQSPLGLSFGLCLAAVEWR